MDAAVDYFKLQRLMNALRQLAIDPGIGSHLDAALGPSPILRRSEQRRAHTLFAMLFGNEPSFEKTHGLTGVASIGMGSQADLDEAYDFSVVLRDENNNWQSSGRCSVKNRLSVERVLFR
jgi:hypothetical protein